jgi:hypothetical protein
MRNNRLKGFLPILLIFVLLNAFFIVGRNMLQRWNADQDVLIIGNALLFVITFISFLLAIRGLKNPNPHAFVRSVYGSIILKLFVCMIAALVYIAIYQKDLNKIALFGCMGLYLVYTFLEVSILTKLLKQKEQ